MHKSDFPCSVGNPSFCDYLQPVCGPGPGHIGQGLIVQGTYCPWGASSKERNIQGTHRPRNASSRGRIIQGTHRARDVWEKT
jgi:hypothetical protein